MRFACHGGCDRSYSLLDDPLVFRVRSPGCREQSTQADHPDEGPSELCAELPSSHVPRRSHLIKDQPSDCNAASGGDRTNAVVESHALTPGSIVLTALGCSRRLLGHRSVSWSSLLATEDPRERAKK